MSDAVASNYILRSFGRLRWDPHVDENWPCQQHFTSNGDL